MSRKTPVTHFPVLKVFTASVYSCSIGSVLDLPAWKPIIVYDFDRRGNSHKEGR